jgi:hypothetical protein
MPISGFSDRVRLERLGKIRLGRRVPSQRNPEVSYPQATPYFVCPSEVQEALKDPQPTSIYPIMFPTDNPDDWMSQFYRCYSLSYGLICMGDGVTANQRTDLATGAIVDRNTKEGNWEWREITCEGEDCPLFISRKCRPMMRLQFLLPEVPGLGVWELVTSSRHSRLNIQSTIHLIRSMAGGRIKMIPLTLSLEDQEATPKGEKKKTIHIVHLKHDLKMGDFLRLANQPIAERFQLASPAGQTPETAAAEDMPEDLMPPFEEEGAPSAATGKPSSTAKAGTKPTETKAPGKPVNKKTEQRKTTDNPIPESDMRHLANSLFAVDSIFADTAWEKIALPMMKEMFDVDSYEALSPGDQHKLWTALKSKFAKDHQTNAGVPESEIVQLGATLWGSGAWERNVLPLMKNLFGCDKYSTLKPDETHQLCEAMKTKAAQDHDHTAGTTTPTGKTPTRKEKDPPHIVTLRRQLQTILMEKGLDLEHCVEWLKTNCGRASTEGMTQQELEEAIGKAKSGGEETAPLF